jgi:hypothetical protein
LDIEEKRGEERRRGEKRGEEGRWGGEGKEKERSEIGYNSAD